MGQQRVDQRAVVVARGRMHDQAHRFVEHDQVRVLIQNGEGNRLRLRRGGDRRRDVEDIGRAEPGVLRRFGDGLAVALQAAFVYQGFDARAGESTGRLGQDAVDALARGFGADGQDKRSGRWRRV